jgi:tetratricopeptide (TPR) repeat protein
MKLEPPDSHYLSAAQGWLELGNHVEAAAELEKVPPALRAHPDVIEVRAAIHARAARWRECIEASSALIRYAPKRPAGWIHRSYALHELKRTLEAFDALLPAVERFPGEWIIPYNLACYCSRLGRLEEARIWLEKAFKLGDRKQLQPLAVTDPDLKMLWTGF